MLIHALWFILVSSLPTVVCFSAVFSLQSKPSSIYFIFSIFFSFFFSVWMLCTIHSFCFVSLFVFLKKSMTPQKKIHPCSKIFSSKKWKDGLTGISSQWRRFLCESQFTEIFLTHPKSSAFP